MFSIVSIYIYTWVGGGGDGKYLVQMMCFTQGFICFICFIFICFLIVKSNVITNEKTNLLTDDNKAQFLRLLLSPD